MSPSSEWTTNVVEVAHGDQVKFPCARFIDAWTLKVPFAPTPCVSVEPYDTVCVKEEPERTPVRITVGNGWVRRVSRVNRPANPFSAAGTDAKTAFPAIWKFP